MEPDKKGERKELVAVLVVVVVELGAELLPLPCLPFGIIEKLKSSVLLCICFLFL